MSDETVDLIVLGAKVLGGIAAGIGFFFGMNKCQEIIVTNKRKRRGLEEEKYTPGSKLRYESPAGKTVNNQTGDDYDWTNPPVIDKSSNTLTSPELEKSSERLAQSLRNVQDFCIKGATVVQSIVQVIDTFKRAFSRRDQQYAYNTAFNCPNPQGYYNNGQPDSYEEHLRNPNKTVVGPDGAVFKWIRHNVVECYPPPNTDFGNRIKYGH